jgi:hypothetical protein
MLINTDGLKMLSSALVCSSDPVCDFEKVTPKLHKHIPYIKVSLSEGGKNPSISIS